MNQKIILDSILILASSFVVIAPNSSAMTLNDSFYESMELEEATIHYIALDKNPDSILIPDWFKKNALWWKDNKISDKEIIFAIENLIERGIISLKTSENALGDVKETDEIKNNTFSEYVDTEQHKQRIPDYVKDVFGLWGKGQISDVEVANAIEYMVKESIISSSGISKQKSSLIFQYQSPKEVLVFNGNEMSDGWKQAVDPTLAKINNQWWMFFSSQDVATWQDLSDSDPLKREGPKIHILAASLPSNQDLNADTSLWEIHSSDVIRPILSPGSRDNNDWDNHAVETAKYVLGFDNVENAWVERIYYTGWERTASKQPDYAIGFAQKEGNSWIKHPKPVLIGTESWEKFNGISTMGDQAVLYKPGLGPNGENGLWHLWYQVYDGIDGSLVHVTSEDGIKWSEKKRLTHLGPFPNAVPSGGPYSSDVFFHNDIFVLFGWVPSDDLKLQGLWKAVSKNPNKDFTNWKPIIFENNGVDWHDSGLTGSSCHKTGLYGPTASVDNGELLIFYHGVKSSNNVNPCMDLSTNIASIGMISFGECDSESCKFIE